MRTMPPDAAAARSSDPMHTLIGAFTLTVEASQGALPPRVSITLVGMPVDEEGVIHLTPTCATLDELESCINALQDELDLMRAAGRQAFAGGAGHA